MNETNTENAAPSQENRKEKKCCGQQGVALCHQITMVIISAMTVFSSGVAMPYPGIMWDYLTNENETIHFTDSYIGLFASMTAIGQPFGALLVGTFVDKVGRKMTLIIASTIATTSFTILTFAIKVEFFSYLAQLLFARFLMGLSTAFGFTTTIIYSAEISQTNLRPILTSLSAVVVTVGNVLAFVLAYFLRNQFRLISGIATVLALIGLSLQFFLYETPSWLLLKEKEEKAMVSFKYLRAVKKTDAALNEANSEEFKKLKENADRNRVDIGRRFSYVDEIKKPDVYNPFFILIGFFFFQNFSGFFVVLVFFIQIAQKAGINSLDPYLVGVCLGSCRFLATVIQAPFLNKLGRRKPALVSSLGMTTCMFILVMVSSKILNVSEFVTLLALLMFIASSTFGVAYIPIALATELYPQRVRGRYVGLTICISFCFTIITLQLFASLLEVLGITIICSFFGIIAFISFFFIYLFVPETKGKTLAEIEQLYL